MLFYDRPRFYDPALGRYISLERIGVAVGLSIYSYAVSGPVSSADPLEPCWKTVLAVVAAVTVAAIVIAFAAITGRELIVAAGAAGMVNGHSTSQR